LGEPQFQLHAKVNNLMLKFISEGPGRVHFSFRCFDDPEEREPMVNDIKKAEQLLWNDGRKVE